MHTVCELKSFQRDAAEAGMTRDEIDELIDFLSLDPMAGEEIQGTGGCRKVRVATRKGQEWRIQNDHFLQRAGFAAVLSDRILEGRAVQPE
jgi:hypothetical protein